jgi:hypothetical protein
MSVPSVFDIVSKAYATQSVDGAALKQAIAGRPLEDVERQAVQHLQNQAANLGWKVDKDAIEVFSAGAASAAQPQGMSWTKWDHTNMHVSPSMMPGMPPYAYWGHPGVQALNAGVQAAAARPWNAARAKKFAIIGGIVGCFMGPGLILTAAIGYFYGGLTEGKAKPQPAPTKS